MFWTGLHMVNIQDPTSPVFAGCFSEDGYTHDAQCVNYDGPDSDYKGREICFNYNEDTLTIVDVTDKKNPVMVSRTGYFGSAYTHQGWLTEDSAYLIMNDELDELSNDFFPFPHTRSMAWDVNDLDTPKLITSFWSPEKVIDHNLYVKGKYAFEANYEAGLRILNIENIANGELSEVGYFDVAPTDKAQLSFFGSWSNYPYFASGNVVISSIERGLFVVTPKLGE